MAASTSIATKIPGKVHCDVCNVYVSSAGLLETHIKGKKHQQMMKLGVEQERASKVSVYVTGFKCSDTNEDEMSDFFSKYGPVKRIYFDKNKGLFAIVEFEHENSAAAILEQTDSVIFKGKTLKIKKRTFASHHKSELEKKEVKDVTVSKKRKKKHSETLSSILPHEIIDKMNQASSVSEQMSVLISELKLSNEELHLRSLICDILKEVFQEFVSTCEVVVYGSSANGLGCKGSDLDITLLVDPNMEHWNIDLEDVADSKRSNTDQKAASEPKDIHCFVVKVLRTLVPGCGNVIPIFTAKCPVIKFTHQTTSISCDLTINNRLGLQNTALLKCYLELDPRVSQLVYTVRTWAKAIGISGGGSGQLTNYALTVMVFNFLQSTDPPVLPSLQDVSGWPMKDMKICVVKELVDGWDCGFYKDIDNLLPSANTKPVETLLEEFYDFYGRTFDYGNHAVTINKHDHFLISSLEEELQELLLSKVTDENENAGAKDESVKTRETVMTWKTTPLCVQDPFERTHNLTQNVGVSALREIIQYMVDARNICQRFSSDGQLNVSSTDRGIVQLLKYTPRTVSKKHKKDGYSFTVTLSDKQDGGTTSAIVLSSFASIESFFQSICHYMEDKLKIKCVVSSEQPLQDCWSVVCTANRNTWTHSRRERRKALQHDEPTTSVPHEGDSSVTQQKSSDEGEDVELPCLVFRLTVSKDPLVKGAECNVKLEHLGGQRLQTFENFYAYFKKQAAVVFK